METPIVFNADILSVPRLDEVRLKILVSGVQINQISF